MASGSKIRTLARQLDASRAVLWVIDARGLLIYVSSGAADWLKVDADSLIKRRAIAGTPASDDRLDRLAASLSPPAGLQERGWMPLRVAPPSDGTAAIPELDVQFARIGDGASAITLAFAGDVKGPVLGQELADALAIRQQLDRWRKQDSTFATIVTAGSSAAARRTRSRLQVATATRTHVAFCGPAGSGAELIARRIHYLSAPGEPLTVVDGPLMDAELLDATIMPLVNQLADSTDATGTALIRGLDETPLEAQQRLADWSSAYPQRLRLLALCSRSPLELDDPFPSDAPQEETSQRRSTETDELYPDGSAAESGLHPKLVDALSALSVQLAPLAARVDDIPVIAAALLDARRAAGEGPAERLSRQALDLLVVYPWPGDFDELDAAIRHAIRTSPHHSIGAEHLPLAIRSYRPTQQDSPSKSPSLPLEEALRQFEKQLIDEAVEAAGGNRAEAARRLGISRGKLLRRLDESTSDE